MNAETQQEEKLQVNELEPRCHKRKSNNKIRPLYVVMACLVFFFVGQSLTGMAQGVIPFFNEPKSSPTQEQTAPVKKDQEDEQTRKIEVEAWKIVLVNPWNSLPQNYQAPLVTIRGGQIDERMLPDLQEMMDDCRAEGLAPVICSAYRTGEKQTRLFNNKVERCLAEGYSQEEAEEEAGKWVAFPGTSEHQLGLALDIVSEDNQVLDESQEKTPEQQWLMENCHKYGFILRYPEDKSEITGISYEPWHYRYVGKEVAAEIMEQGLCLEEYLENIKQN